MITRGETPRVRRVCVLAWGAAAVSWELSTPGRLGASLASCAATLLLAAGCALHIRHALMAELRRVQEIAGAAQRAVLRPLPGRIQGLTPAAAQLSASRGAAVLGTFREAAYGEPGLGGVLVRMERALARHVLAQDAAEEFVTVLLLQIAQDGSVLALNCGHPWPYLLREPRPLEPCGALPRVGPGRRVRAEPGRRDRAVEGAARRRTVVRSLGGGEVLPPLGVVPVPPGPPAQDCGQLWPGDVLFLHTDGAEDARDAAGRFFPLRSVLAELPADTPARLVAGGHAELLRHTGGQLTDDVALLALRSDRNP
ncbi:SpoIIE family protein phosphatase [Streptomyces vinaceus]|uniref:SpoIIE family protein phosphatase n=1 Tax=Streptomyces vinaceus TaxID=1960 RepID=UPI0037FDAAB3